MRSSGEDLAISKGIMVRKVRRVGIKPVTDHASYSVDFTQRDTAKKCAIWIPGKDEVSDAIWRVLTEHKIT